MKKALGAIPAVFPMPVLMVAAYDENGKVNVMNAAWGMISDMAQITLFLSEDHKTTANIMASKAFTVALADKDHMDVADFWGIASGNTMEDKFERTGYTAVKSEFVNAPIIEEYPVTLECKVRSWDTKTGYLIGEIVSMQADESVLTDGKVDLGKLKPIIFDPSFNAYRVVGEVVGKAFQDGLRIKG